MRISIIKDDPGFDARALLKHVKVFLNGDELHNCITADEEKGTVYCHELNDNGEMFIDPSSGDETKKITLTGEVKIILPADFYE